MKQKVLSGLAMLALVMVALLLPAPASAAPGDNYWHANAGSTLDGTMKGGNTSIETTKAFAEAGVTADKGDVLDLDYTLGDGATCIGGAPRVFATVDGVTVNSWDQHIGEGVEAACKAEVTLPAGHVEAIGIVWDNGQEGTITVTSLKAVGENGFTFNLNDYEVATLDTVKAPTATAPTCEKKGVVTLPEQTGVKYTKTTAGGKATVKAEAVFGYEIKSGVKTTWTFPVAKLTGAQCEPTDEPTNPGNGGGTPTTEPTGTPTGTPTTGTPSASSSPTSSLSPVAGAVGGGSDDGSLPKTGVKALGLFGIGGLLVATGGIILVLLRRKRDQQPGMHRTNDGDTQVFPAI